MFMKMSIKKIMVATSAILILVIMYLLPDTSTKEIELNKSSIEYIYDNTIDTIYLIDSHDYVARTSIATCNCDVLDKAMDLADSLIIDGKKSNIIPNGFRSIIPAGTRVLDVELDNGVLTIDFSSELLEVNKNDENKMIESIIYTLTSIDGIDSIIIKIEGDVLNNLPSGIKVPTILNRDFGINKSYDLVSTKDIDYYTTFFMNKYNDYEYYVPVTKYINSDNNDKIKIIIKELSSSPIYETNLMSYLNANTEIYDYELSNNNLKLNFNNMVLSDVDSNKILEEVMYTIGLSLCDELNLDEVIFMVNNREISTFLAKNA